MQIIEKNDSEGIYLLIKRNGKYYRTESFEYLASLYMSLPLPIFKFKDIENFNLICKEKFGTLFLSNVGTYIFNVL